MKALLIFIGMILLSLTANLLAVPDSTKIGRTLALMSDEVNLSDAQAEQIRVILASRFEQAQKDRGHKWKDENAPIKIARERMRITDSIIETILTDQQIPAFRKFIRDVRDHAISKDLLALAEYLNLTDEQATQFGTILFNYEQGKPQNSGEARPAAIDPVMMKERKDERLEELNSQLEMILTQQQLYKYEQFKEEQKKRLPEPKPRDNK